MFVLMLCFLHLKCKSDELPPAVLSKHVDVFEFIKAITWIESLTHKDNEQLMNSRHEYIKIGRCKNSRTKTKH